LSIDRSESIDSKLDKLFDHIPLPIPFGHRDGKMQSIFVIARSKGSSLVIDPNGFFVDSL
jgi:hypothetical protein